MVNLLLVPALTQLDPIELATGMYKRDILKRLSGKDVRIILENIIISRRNICIKLSSFFVSVSSTILQIIAADVYLNFSLDLPFSHK